MPYAPSRAIASLLIAGEEPEMCFRMRKLGYRVMRLADEMTLHDAAMFQSEPMVPAEPPRRSCRRRWWRLLHGRDAERPVRPAVRALFWGLSWPIGSRSQSASLAGLCGWALLQLDRSSSSGARIGASDGWALARQPMRASTRRHASRQGAGSRGGAMTYVSNRVRNRPSTLLEYKSKVMGT